MYISMKWYKLVLLLNLIVLKCWAMTQNELEEFSDYLEKTAQLDLNLKSNPDVDADEDETVSDNAWEESGKFEGDLILNARQRRLIVEDVAEGLSRNGLRDSTKRWPDNEVVFFIQREHFSEDQLEAIQNGIDDIAQASCIKFRPYRKGDKDAVVIQGSRRGCFSQVGYQGGYQVLNLNGRHPVGRGCFRHGTVVHEMLHTLGFYHMQSSPDRDDYIDVLWENIVQPARHNFRKYNTFSVSDFGVGYDYDSVLHYSKKAFSSNGQDTLVPKQNGADIGQRVGLSEKDSQKLNKMYCDADSNNDDEENHKIKKKPNKKKNPKNKPFEGHGIGYHQGKTVVIKLPAAETYRLPDIPSFHIFDYFSKPPQAVSQTPFGSHGFGERIIPSHDLTITKPNEIYSTDVHANDEYNKSNTDKDDVHNGVDKLNQTLKKSNEEDRENVQNFIDSMSIQDKFINEKSIIDLMDISKTYKKLNDEIKERVYFYDGKDNINLKKDNGNNSNEFQISNEKFKIGKPNLDISKIIKNINYDIDDSPARPTPTAFYGTETETDSYEGKLEKPVLNYEEIDLSHRTSLPEYNSKYFIKAPSMSAEINIYPKSNLSDAYVYAKQEAGMKYRKLLEENIPKNINWNGNDGLKKHDVEYDHESYSSKEDTDYTQTHGQIKIPGYLRHPTFVKSNLNMQESHSISMPVPILSKAWYKIYNADDSFADIGSGNDREDNIYYKSLENKRN